jgi:hypothetical protein
MISLKGKQQQLSVMYDDFLGMLQHYICVFRSWLLIMAARKRIFMERVSYFSHEISILENVNVINMRSHKTRAQNSLFITSETFNF